MGKKKETKKITGDLLQDSNLILNLFEGQSAYHIKDVLQYTEQRVESYCFLSVPIRFKKPS
jgi:hypothetical protein